MKQCTQCLIHKELNEFYRNKKNKDGLRSNCKPCSNLQSSKWVKNNKEKVKQTRLAYTSLESVKIQRCKLAKAWNRKSCESTLLTKAKKRAKEKNLPFNLTKTDIFIPEICPALGIQLKVNDDKLGDCSPTLDRFIPELGYVVGNIVVISARANRIKNNASIDEIGKIFSWMKEYNAKQS